MLVNVALVEWGSGAGGTGSVLVLAYNKGGWDTVAAEVEKLVSSIELSAENVTDLQ